MDLFFTARKNKASTTTLNNFFSNRKLTALQKIEINIFELSR